jgi:hypothetical protein
MNGLPSQPNQPSPYQRAIDKYKELYAYSTDVLLKEHERFNRADEKASKYATTFVFLISAFAFFDKAIIDEMLPPCGLIEWALAVVGLAGLIVSLWGWYRANSVIQLRPYISRRLDGEMISFFRKESLLNIYYGLAKENTEAYEENQRSALRKHQLLFKIAGKLKISVAILAVVAVLFGVRRYLMAL